MEKVFLTMFRMIRESSTTRIVFIQNFLMVRELGGKPHTQRSRRNRAAGIMFGGTAFLYNIKIARKNQPVLLAFAPR
jgi:hypothetical protein